MLTTLFPVLYTGLIPLAIIAWSWQILNRDAKAGDK